MVKKSVILFGVILIVLIGWFNNYYNMNKFKNRSLTIGLPESWGPLSPPKQSTAYAEIVLSNIFETLVEEDLNGNLVPNLAKSWEISKDFKTIEFKLDILRKFSNGQRLTAQIYKEALEHSLLVESVSNNSSSLDILYMVEGFANFKSTKHLDGIIAESEDKLIFRFQYPFRQALNELTGIRFSVYIAIDENKYVGTGPYVISNENSKVVALKKNEFWNGKHLFDDVKLYALGANQIQSFLNEEFDVYMFGTNLPKHNDVPKTYQLGAGGYLTHSVADINGLEGRVFSNQQFRRALLYIFYNKISPEVEKMYGAIFFKNDIQFFQELQYGRLDKKNIETIINEGERYVDDLIKETQIRPLKICSSNHQILSLISTQLASLGIMTKSEEIEFGEVLEKYYKTYDFDILLTGSGTGSNDPDNIYHKLGKNGAITSPAIGRKNVWNYFEEGRTLVSPEDLDLVYRKATEAILVEVPALHIGFLRTAFAFNAQKVRLKTDAMNKDGLKVVDFDIP